MINSLIILAATNNTTSTPWWVYLLFALAGSVAMKLAKGNRAERNRRDEYDDRYGGDEDDDDDEDEKDSDYDDDD